MDDQGDVIGLLSRPETFGVDEVEVVETHASLVFLAGNRAFKLKRAVRYTYLDYSTCELRRQACEAEHVINRRFAPTLYLGVEPVVQTNGRLQLGGEGTPVDWVLVMRRFEQAAQLDRMAEQRLLTVELMRSLTDVIAALHRSAEIRPADGGATGLGRALAITIENLRLETGGTFTAEDVEDWVAHAANSLRAQAALLDRRQLAGRVRACHGDLHLRNICLLDGKPTPFDAIEFDPHLSSIDVLYDLAFLLMDLQERDLGRLGNAVFNRYLDLADERGGLSALPLFMSLRAAIRAQVAAAAQHRTDAPDKARRFRAEALRYLELARELIKPAESSCLVAVGGLSGTGKSTLAYALAPHIGRPPGARVVRSDVVRKRAAAVPLESRLGADAYTSEARARTYQMVVDEVRLCLEGGHAAIADAVFAVASDRLTIEALAQQTDVRFHGLWLVAPAEVLLSRITGRVADASDATQDVVRAQLTHPPSPPAGWRVVDASGSSEAVLLAALAALGSERPE